MYLFALSVLVGIFVGVLGNGADILLLPILVHYGYSFQEAVAISLFLSIIPSTIPGLLLYNKNGFFKLMPGITVLIAITVGIIIGSYIGSNKIIADKWLYRAYVILMFGMTVYLLTYHCELF